MGFLTEGGRAAKKTDEAPDDSELPETDVSDDSQQDAAPEREEPKGERVEIKQPSRRQRAHLELQETFKKSLSEATETFQSQLRERDNQIAQMLGRLEAIQSSRPAPVEPERPKITDDQIEEVERAADEALAKNDYTSYRKHQRKLTRLIADQAAEEKFSRVPAQSEPQPGGIPPALLGFAVAHPDVIQKDPNLNWVRLKDQELEMMGWKPGPERVKKAFEMASQVLSGSAKSSGTGFSTSTAPILSGVPTNTGRAGGGSRAPGVILTDHEKFVAKKAGMTLEEYARNLAATHPDRVVK